ncbi:conserved Plasmodium protein, unknown function [Plasmodium relictum]|uniref:AP5B1 C-terminal domain-containing protein n=1 Tax=Plasmodium relictum TaxID=85471 RepID=A0A1J1HEZ0_PLARL|nr:conserved Plasmodium protein, unknown function [Plasmodium relictum]CRH02626.1 conserved Plasmodium protein, unknown function [Plasmodium relictum]
MESNKKINRILKKNKTKKRDKLDDEFFEIIIYNILSLIIVNIELNNRYANNKIINSIILKNIDFISNNIFILSFENIQKLLFIIDLILNNEGVYYKFKKNGDNNLNSNKLKRCNQKKKDAEKKTNESFVNFVDIHSLNNYINDIFIYIEDKNIYLSIFHLSYIFKNNEDYQKYFLKRYINYTFKKFFTDIIKVYSKTNKNINLLIRKKKYLYLYESVIQYHKQNFNLLDKDDKDELSTLSDCMSSSSISDGNSNIRYMKLSNNDIKYIKGNKDENSVSFKNKDKRKKEIAKNNEEYIEYNIVTKEKIRKLYMYKKKKLRLIINNNFINKHSYIPINLFPNNDLNIANIKFQALSANIIIKIHLLFLYTNIILFFNLFNSSLYQWVYKFISFLLNVLNNFNVNSYFYLDNSSILSHFNNENSYILNKHTLENKFITKINNLDNKRTYILKSFLEKNSKENNKTNINFPCYNCGSIEVYEKSKKKNSKKLYFHQFINIKILKYYSILSLLEIENFYKGILSSLLGDIYNKTISNICKFQRKENYYEIHLINTNNEHFKNNNLDLFILIEEMKKIRLHNNNDDIVIKSLEYLYFFILFNYINILIEYHIIDNLHIKYDKNLSISDDIYNNKNISYIYHGQSNLNIAEEKNNFKSINKIKKIENKINNFINENYIRLELQEFRKSKYILEGIRNYYFYGSLITLPFYINLNTLEYFFQIYNTTNTIQDNSKNNVNNDNYTNRRKEECLFKIFINCKNLIRDKLRNILNNNIDLIFHFGSYLIYFLSDFVILLKKYNYFFYSNSYHFLLCLKYMYILYGNLDKEVINEMYEKVLLVIKNNHYTNVSKIYIIYIFSFFLEKKYIVNLCAKDIKEFFPNFLDCKDLAIIKYYFILKLIKNKNITISLLDIYKNLYTHYHYEITEYSSKNVSIINILNNASTDLLNKEKINNYYNIEKKNSNSKKYVYLEIKSSKKDIEDFYKSDNHKKCKKIYFKNRKNNYIIELNNILGYMHENNREKKRTYKYNKRTIYSSILFDNEEKKNNIDKRNLKYFINNFIKKKRKYTSKNKLYFYDINGNNSFLNLNENSFNFLVEEDYVNKDDIIFSFSTKDKIHINNKNFLMFSYHLLKFCKCYNLKNELKIIVVNVLLFNMNKMNIILFILHYLYTNKEIKLFNFIQNAILEYLQNLNPRYKVMNFLIFLFHLVKIRYANVHLITKILNNVLKKYKFSIKIYIIVIKILKIILQHHDIYNNYMLCILDNIKDNKNAYLYKISIYYSNIIENKISFLECNKLRSEKAYSYDLTKNSSISNSKDYIKKEINESTNEKKCSELKFMYKNIKSNYIKLEFCKLDRKNILALNDNGCSIFYIQNYGIEKKNKNKDDFFLNKYYNDDNFNSKLFYSIYKDKSYDIKNYYNFIVNNHHYIYFPFLLQYINNSPKKKKKKKKINNKKLFCLNICFVHKIDFINMHNVYIPYIELNNNEDLDNGNSNDAYVNSCGNNCNKEENMTTIIKTEKNCTYNKNKKETIDNLYVNEVDNFEGNYNRKKSNFEFSRSIREEFCNVNTENINEGYNVNLYRNTKSKIKNNIKRENGEKKKKFFKNENKIRIKIQSCGKQVYRNAKLYNVFKRNKIFALKNNKFYFVSYSYIFYGTKVKNMMYSLTRNSKKKNKTKKKELNQYKKIETDRINKQEYIKNKISSNNFLYLKKDLIKKENYKILYKLKKNFFKRLNCYIKKENINENLNLKKKREILNQYKLLIKVDVKLLITTYFYAYVVYLNRKKKTFKSFLGKYKINFNDFFLPFKASYKYWKYIFEDLWNNKICKMYESAKYLNCLSHHIVQVINEKLHPFLIKENPNIKNRNIYNSSKYNMHIGKTYDLNDNYCAYYIKRNNIKKKLKHEIFDEFFIDNYSLYSNDFDSNKYSKKNIHKERMSKKRKILFFKCYKPKHLKELFDFIICVYNYSNNLDKENIVKKEIKVIKNTKKRCDLNIFNKEYSSINQKTNFKCFINHKPIITKRKKIRKNIVLKNLNTEKYKLFKKIYRKILYLALSKYYYLIKKERKKKKKKIDKNNCNNNRNHNVIKKFIGIFLPPRHHLLLVFYIYKKSTLVQIRTDNLNILNYLNPFFNECNISIYIYILSYSNIFGKKNSI